MNQRQHSDEVMSLPGGWPLVMGSSFISLAMMKYPHKKPFLREGIHLSSQFQAMVHLFGEVKWWGLEAAGHTMSLVKSSERACLLTTQLTSLLFYDSVS